MPSLSSLRVAVWGTGGVGSNAVQSIARRPDLDLVGVWVHSPDKVGQDAGTLTGGEPLGLEASGDADELLARGLDCVVYAASDGGMRAFAVDDYVRFLEAGVNVVTVTTPALIHPPAYDPQARARLEEAAGRGGATLYASGIEPGFAGDHLVALLLTLSRRVDSVRSQEIFSYANYPVATTMFDVFGFGRPLEYTPVMAMPGVQQATWGPVVHMVAAALGAELDEVRETYEREVTDRQLEVACGVIEAGTVGAVRFETIGVVGGRDAIVLEHVNRMAPDVAPHWPTAPQDGTYRIVVDGQPSMRCDLVLGSSPETSSPDGMLATTMRVVNAIPAVCAAPPGLATALDLPLTLPRAAL